MATKEKRNPDTRRRRSDINASDRYSHAVLERQAVKGDRARVRLLLGEGAINAKDESDRTTLHRKVLNKSDTALQLLLKEGADIKVINTHDDAALHKIIDWDKQETVRLLLK